MTTNDVSDTGISDERLANALADLTDCFLEKHGCFPIDNKRWNAAMVEAYALIGQPGTHSRTDKMSTFTSRHPQPVNEPGEWQVEAAAEVLRNYGMEHGNITAARLALRAASIPKVEPSPSTSEGIAFAWAWKPDDEGGWTLLFRKPDTGIAKPLYAAPQPTPIAPVPVGVTPEQAAIDALQPFHDAVFNDNGDITVNGPYDYEFAVAAYFAHRKLTAALSPKSGEEG